MEKKKNASRKLHAQTLSCERSEERVDEEELARLPRRSESVNVPRVVRSKTRERERDARSAYTNRIYYIYSLTFFSLLFIRAFCFSHDDLLNPNPLSSAYLVMKRKNLSHSCELRMMYRASMHFGFPFTNFAFTSTWCHC